jgi:hypothetical protein
MCKILFFIIRIRVAATHAVLILASFIERVPFCFRMCSFLQGNYLYANTHLWSLVIPFPLFVRRKFVVCRRVYFEKLGCTGGEGHWRMRIVAHGLL